MIQTERIQPLNNKAVPGDGRYVMYWMQQSQRTDSNHALEHAIERANTLKIPCFVLFSVTDNYPEATLRHYAFMIEGLAQTRAALERRGIRMLVRHQSPEHAALALSERAAMIVTDRGYLRHQKAWRFHVARHAACPVVQVESDVVVPVETASDKEEFAARTLRPRIHRHINKFLIPVEMNELRRDSLSLRLPKEFALDVSDPRAALAVLKVDRSVGAVSAFRGGPEEAKKLLSVFVSRKLAEYDQARNEPAADGVSHMSPYLHFGQVSPIDIALAAKRAAAPDTAKETFIEELVVRRELSMNFVHYNTDYDRFECLPAWAQQTLRIHEKDPRPHLYTHAELEAARTHDPYWNAAQLEMVRTGKMHNYMRMYWGKKIIEWTASPREAFEIALRLNNRHQLDGRDANSFAGVAWLFGKHDRPWTRRPIFGTVRYMNAAGLERKFDIDAYVRKVETMSDDPIALGGE